MKRMQKSGAQGTGHEGGGHGRAVRIPVSWGRLFPHGPDTEPDEHELTMYEALIEGYLSRGCRPVLVLEAGDVPRCHGAGSIGWSDRMASDLFVRFAATCADHFGAEDVGWAVVDVVDERLAGDGVMEGLGLFGCAEGDAAHVAFVSASRRLVATARAITYVRAVSPRAHVHAAVMTRSGRHVAFLERAQAEGVFPEQALRALERRTLAHDITADDRRDLSTGRPDAPSPEDPGVVPPDLLFAA